MKKMSNTNWYELVNQAKKNDQSAITKLYELTIQNAYFVAISMMKNEDDTFDVLQNAYIKAYNKLDTLENPEKFQSWLNQIVSNECKMALRKHKDFTFSDFETEDGYDFGNTVENDNIVFNPDSNIEYEETKKAMEEILHKLPDEQRLVVLMFYFQELSIKEIASILECSENTVKSRLNYAKKKIRTEVEELEKKGHKLYGIAPLPLFLWFIKKMARESSVPKALSSSIAKALSASAVTASSGAIAGTVAKAGLTLAHKIIIGVVATAVAVTGTVAGVTKLKDVSSTPEETPTEITNQSAESDTPTPITEDEIKKLLYDSLEYYDTYLYGRDYAHTEKIDMGTPIVEKDGYYLEEHTKYKSYDECVSGLQEYYSESAIQKITKETNLTEYDGKCYMNIRESGDPVREIKSIDSVEKIDETKYAIHMTLNNYFEDKTESSVMYCVYENGHWVMDSINYYEPMSSTIDNMVSKADTEALKYHRDDYDTNRFSELAVEYGNHVIYSDFNFSYSSVTGSIKLYNKTTKETTELIPVATYQLLLYEDLLFFVDEDDKTLCVMNLKNAISSSNPAVSVIDENISTKSAYGGYFGCTYGICLKDNNVVYVTDEVDTNTQCVYKYNIDNYKSFINFGSPTLVASKEYTHLDHYCISLTNYYEDYYYEYDENGNIVTTESDNTTSVFESENDTYLIYEDDYDDTYIIYNKMTNESCELNPELVMSSDDVYFNTSVVDGKVYIAYQELKDPNSTYRDFEAKIKIIDIEI